MGAPQISETFRRVRRDHVREDAGKIRFSTRGRPSQVVTAEEAERILQLLPGKRAAAFRIGEKLQPKKARADSLYVMRYSIDATCVKIVRSDNVEGRRRHLEAGQNFSGSAGNFSGGRVPGGTAARTASGKAQFRRRGEGMV